jgi:tRNA(Ile)-lysidine synthase
MLNPNALPQSSDLSMVGVSGGVDSILLLHLLHERGYQRLIVCHLNHQLRGAEAEGDARFVEALATRLGYDFEGRSVDLRMVAAETKESIETTGRRLRQGFFAEVAQRRGCPRLLLAHHADDQAESVLMNLLRGSGLRGLAGMAECNCMSFGQQLIDVYRPLLRSRKAEIMGEALRRGLAHREDLTNQLDDTTRNALRLAGIPLLSQIMRREIQPSVLRLSDVVRRDDDCLAVMTAGLIRDHSLISPSGGLRLHPALVAAHPALQARVIESWFRHLAVGGLSHRIIEATLSLLIKASPSRVNLPQGRQVRRKAGWLTVVTLT